MCRILATLTFLAASLGGLAATRPAAAEDGTLAIVGGRVFDGERFVEQDFFVADGVFVAVWPARVDQTIDAAGLYLLAPLAEAHTHTFFGGPRSRMANDAYLKSGVFYALCANNPIEVSREFRTWSAEELGGAKVDALFANGGVTAPGGHPVPLYRTIHTRMFQQPESTFMASADDNVFHQAADTGELEAKWPKLMAGEPDVVKLYLLGHNKGGQAFEMNGRKGHNTGLTEAVFRAAVARAHASGKRCIVHVETADDFALAVDAGADAVAHTPYALNADPADKVITHELARRAAARPTAVITTSGLGLTVLNAQADPAAKARLRELWAGNLRALKEANVTLLVGSDGFSPLTEANALRESGVFTPAELLSAWTRDTPRWMFPDRKLGALEPGHEASVIGFATDPTSDWSALQRVSLRIKGGRVLQAAEGGAATPPATQGAELMK